MKLLELLVKERIKWPSTGSELAQDDVGRIIVPNHPLRMEMSSLPEGLPIADDQQTAIVTKEQYDNACKLVDNGYTLWFGGECPVDGDIHVDVWVSTGKKGEAPYFTAKHWRWEWEDGLDNIIAYKVAVAKPDGSREPISFNCRCGSVPVVTEYPAHSFLEKGVQHMKDRAAQRDSAEGERSMAACVNAFNAMFGKNLTETQGWQFMVLLKMARSRNKFNPDDYEDGAAYTGLAGEAHSHDN